MIENWKDVLISIDCTIEDAIKVIDKASMRVAIVVDKNNKLLGLVTDGDVRRGLLKNIKLGENISKIMNAQPKTINEGASKEQVSAILEENKLIQIPLVTAGNVVVGVETLEHLAWTGKRDNAVFLMVGGYGKRLQLSITLIASSMVQSIEIKTSFQFSIIKHQSFLIRSPAW